MGGLSSTTQVSATHDVEWRPYNSETGALAPIRSELTASQRSLLLEKLHLDRRALLVERRGTGLSAGREALLQDILAEIDLLELQELKESLPDVRTEIEALAREVLGLKHR